MIARSLFIAGFVLVAQLLMATPSLACSCQAYTPPELASVAEVVFTGMARVYGEDRLMSTAVEFQVDTVYKGPLLPKIHIQALGARGISALGAGCGWGIQIGRRYTIFALDHDADGVPNTNGCLQPVEGPISAATYGLPQGRAPTQHAEVARLAVVAVVALAILVLVSILARPRPLSP